MRKHGVSVLLGVVAGVALVLGRLVLDAVGLLLGKSDDLLVTRKNHGLLLGIGDDAVCLLLRTVERLLLLLEDAAGILELLREDPANLVENLVHVLGVDDLLLAAAGKRGLRLVH